MNFGEECIENSFVREVAVESPKEGLNIFKKHSLMPREEGKQKLFNQVVRISLHIIHCDLDGLDELTKLDECDGTDWQLLFISP